MQPVGYCLTLVRSVLAAVLLDDTAVAEGATTRGVLDVALGVTASPHGPDTSPESLLGLEYPSVLPHDGWFLPLAVN